jgi:hypothetical protein
MAKTGVLSVSPNLLCRVIPLKRFYLLFDKLYIESSTFQNAIGMLLANNKPSTIETNPKNLREYIIDDDNFNVVINNIEGIGFLKKEGFLDIQGIVVKSNTNILDDYLLSLEGTLDEIFDQTARTLSLVKQIEDEEDTYPLLICPPKEKSPGKKTSVANFILSNIPEPNESVSWEQLKDFKSDPDTMRKYYALIKWINEVARKEITPSEVEEEYKYLYHEYVNQYKIHKLKYNLGVLETIVTAAIDVLSGPLGVGPISTSLFSIWKQNLNLLEAETRFTGREVAYIYKVEQKLGK